MAKRIVTQAFVLNRVDGQKAFGIGEELTGDDADHWYAQAFSKEVVEEAPAETAAEKKAREKAEKEAAKAAAAAASAEAPAETAASDEQQQQ